MNGYRKDFDEPKNVSYLIKITNYWKNTLKFGIKSVTLLGKNLIVIWYAMKNIWKLK